MRIWPQLPEARKNGLCPFDEPEVTTGRKRIHGVPGKFGQMLGTFQRLRVAPLGKCQDARKFAKPWRRKRLKSPCHIQYRLRLCPLATVSQCKGPVCQHPRIARIQRNGSLADAQGGVKIADAEESPGVDGVGHCIERIDGDRLCRKPRSLGGVFFCKVLNPDVAIGGTQPGEGFRVPRIERYGPLKALQCCAIAGAGSFLKCQ